jgi:predicted secreted protein
MSAFSTFAVYFIIWWLTLFAVLPFGVRTQAEENDVVLGTVESAPARFRGLRVVLLTTVVAALIHFGWYVLSVKLGYDLDTIFSFIAPEV